MILKPVDEATLQEGDPLLVYNGISVWSTKWKWVMVDPKTVSYPVTHVAPLDLPYPMRRNQPVYSEWEDRLNTMLKKCRSS